MQAFELNYIYSSCAIQVESNIEYLNGKHNIGISVNLRIHEAQSIIDESEREFERISSNASYASMSSAILSGLKRTDEIFLKEVVFSWNKTKENKALIVNIEDFLKEAINKMDVMQKPLKEIMKKELFTPIEEELQRTDMKLDKRNEALRDLKEIEDDQEGKRKIEKARISGVVDFFANLSTIYKNLEPYTSILLTYLKELLKSISH